MSKDKSSSEQRRCHHCQRTGHLIADCESRKAGKPPVQRPDGGASKRSGGRKDQAEKPEASAITALKRHFNKIVRSATGYTLGEGASLTLGVKTTPCSLNCSTMLEKVVLGAATPADHAANVAAATALMAQLSTDLAAAVGTAAEVGIQRRLEELRAAASARPGSVVVTINFGSNSTAIKADRAALERVSGSDGVVALYQTAHKMWVALIKPKTPENNHTALSLISEETHTNWSTGGTSSIALSIELDQQKLVPYAAESLCFGTMRQCYKALYVPNTKCSFSTLLDLARYPFAFHEPAELWFTAEGGSLASVTAGSLVTIARRLREAPQVALRVCAAEDGKHRFDFEGMTRTFTMTAYDSCAAKCAGVIRAVKELACCTRDQEVRHAVAELLDGLLTSDAC